MRRIVLTSLLIFFLGTLFSAGCHSPQRRDSFTPEVLAEFTGPGDANLILIPVRFDEEEYLFCLDTGSTITVFDVSLKNKLGKRILWPKKGSAAGGKSIKVEYFRAPRAYLGPLKLKGRTIIGVVDLGLVSPPLAGKVRGIIGMDFLKKYVVRIDFDTATVSFLKSKRDTGIFSFFQPERNEHPDWGQQLSIKYEFLSGLPLVKGRVVNDIPVNFIVDTGHVSPKIDGDLKSSIFEKVSSKIEFESKEGFNKVAVIDKFSIGSFQYRDAVFYESNDSSLGMEFLHRHLVTFDFPNRKMYLKKGRHFDSPTETHVSIGGLGFELRRRRNNIFVDSIDPNGPAYKKGIRQNDIIVKLDNQDISSYGLVELVEFLSQTHKEKGEVVTFTVKRGNETKHVSFGKNDMVPENNGTD